MGTGRAMGSHHSARAKTHTWITPRHIIEALGPFDLDPCAAPAQPWPCAAKQYTEAEDGLSKPWEGMVWPNPPYGMHAWKWLNRLAAHGNGIALIFARTETAGFFREVWDKAHSMLFLEGRLFFCREDGIAARANAGAPSVLVAYGEPATRRIFDSKLAGAFVHGWARSGKRR